MLLALTALLALGAAGASAAVKYPRLGEIAGPRAGEHFTRLRSESVAVSDHNGHIYVAGSQSGEEAEIGPAHVYDFASAADTSPEVWDGSNTPAGSFGVSLLALAVDNASGDVYVADTLHKVIDKFDQNGNLIASFGDSENEITHEPEPNGQLAGLKTPAASFSPPSLGSFGIAVDQATHDLYVIDAGHQVIDVFDQSGAYLKQITATPEGLYNNFTDGIAVNATSGHVFASATTSRQAFEFDSSGAFLSNWNGNDKPLPSSKTPAEGFGAYVPVAVNDTSGDVYIASTYPEGFVNQFDSTGEYLSRIEGVPGAGAGGAGLAVDQATGNLYVSDDANEQGSIKIFGPEAVLLPTVATTGPTAVGPTTATLNGTVDPEGIEVSGCHFEYVDAAHYQPGAFNPYAAGQSAPCVPAPGSGSTPVAVHADITGLEVGTAYHYRLLAANANGSESGAGELLATPPKPAIEAAAASEVTATSAQLSAEVNPEGAETTCLIEWGQTAEPGNPTLPYEHTEHCNPFELGAGSAAVPVSLQLSGLSPNTSYHWRLVATNASGTTTGAEHTFVFLGPPAHESCPQNEAFRTGPSAPLPDCRAYEMVTPLHKNAALIGNGLFTIFPHLSEDGSRLILSSVQCFSGAGSCVINRGLIGTQFSFGRTATGWATTPLAPSGTQFNNNTIWDVDPDTGATLFSAPTQPGAVDDFHVRAADGSISRIGPVVPQAGFPYGAQGANHLSTADFSHFVYEETGGAWPFDATLNGSASSRSVYEYAGPAAHPFLVGVSGAQGSTDLISACRTTITGSTPLSTDGHIVYVTVGGSIEETAQHNGVPTKCFGSGENAGTEVPADALYARIDGEGPAARTVAISARSTTECSGECAVSPPAGANLQGASEDGTKAFFTSAQQLTNSATQGAGSAASKGCSTEGADCNLYLYENPQEHPLTGSHLIDVSAGDTSGNGPQVQGAFAISADGSHVYFVAKGVLASNDGAALDPATGQPEKAQAGAENLYLYERDPAHPGGRTTFIAKLLQSDADQPDGIGTNAWEGGPALANVTPDGRFLVFDSGAALTADTGRSGVQQVFRYDAQSEELLRLSIGERGFNDNGNNPADAVCERECPDAATIVPGGYTGFRHDPTMSHDGSRVFFRSPLALTPGALDDEQIGTHEGTPIYAQNVYEWEANGSGGCEEARGCVSLISDGRDASSAGSATCSAGSAVCLIGTDATGSNVFFTTTDQLVPQDSDTQLDFYDARVGGGFTETAGVTPCQSSEACHQGGTAEGPASSPATPGFSGKEEGPKHAQCKKGQVKKHGKCVKKSAKKHHKKNGHKKQKRASSNHGGHK